MNTFYCFIAVGKSMVPSAAVFSSADKISQLLSERYEAAKSYHRTTVNPDEWAYPSFGLIDTAGSNIEWNALWDAAYRHLVEKCGVAPSAAKAGLEKTAMYKIGTFAYLTGRVTFGVPIEQT